jgi:hypothetical protein
MHAKARYLAQILECYRKLHGSLGGVLSDDRKTALVLHDRHIGLDVVQQAFVLALARRSVNEHREPIRTLRYFLPVIEEIVHTPPDAAYLQHLERRLRDADLDPPG